MCTKEGMVLKPAVDCFHTACKKMGINKMALSGDSESLPGREII